ncbi:MAG: hypothetical protein A2Y80_02465 [Deltaproteobacteria bacterium RBG_13_58_19]|nr:MAG: hypothetical protein A2Y80_02465 [Deltaproteobacteria bacterium RBG_13_58_19]
MQPGEIVFITLELSPYFKITGVGDLLRNVVRELARRKVKVTVISPDFGVEYPELCFGKSRSFFSSICGHTSPFQVRLAEDGQGVRYFFIKDAELQRYLTEMSADPPKDKIGRICLEFCYGVYLILNALARGELDPAEPDRLVVHTFHWQTGPVLALINQAQWRDRVRTVLTVDILDIQGRFEPGVLETHEIYHSIKSEFREEINFLRLGIEKADLLHTVSPNFAREIQHAPNGRGLESLLQERFREGRLTGILNGLDPQHTDWRCLPILKDNDLCIAPDIENVGEQKQRAKLIFQKVAGLPQDPTAFLISMGHRFVRQKNFAVVVNALEGLMSINPRPQIYLRAWPEPDRQHPDWELWWQIIRLSKRYHYNLAFLSPYDRDQSLDREGIFIDRFLYYAASDLFLMPSLWEPCGLCQLEAMQFGAIPLVTAVGGLVDTVKPYNGEDQGWGFWLEDPFDSQGMVDLVSQAMGLCAHQPQVWEGMVRRALAFDSCITKTVDNYITKLYAE